MRLKLNWQEFMIIRKGKRDHQTECNELQERSDNRQVRAQQSKPGENCPSFKEILGTKTKFCYCRAEKLLADDVRKM